VCRMGGAASRGVMQRSSPDGKQFQLQGQALRKDAAVPAKLLPPARGDGRHTATRGHADATRAPALPNLSGRGVGAAGRGSIASFKGVARGVPGGRGAMKPWGEKPLTPMELAAAGVCVCVCV